MEEKEYTPEEKKRIIQSLRNKFEAVEKKAQEEIENESCYMDYGRL